jgi:hypothetical protein
MTMNIRDGPRMHLGVVRLTSGRVLSTSKRHPGVRHDAVAASWDLSRSVVGMT